MARKKGIDFEESLEALESIVEQMEDGDLSLEESLAAFEKGVKLARDCQDALKAAEQRVQVLLAQGGTEQLAPFADESDESGDDEDA